MLMKQSQQQPQKQSKSKLIESNVKSLNTDFSMSDSMTYPCVMNRTGNMTDESAMDLAAADEGDSIIN